MLDIGRYKITEMIGRGAMGEVWLAEDGRLGRRVALKFLSLNPALSDAEQEEAVERFQREGRAAGKLSHRNIVVIYDIGETEGRHFISMEYLPGLTLEKVIARGPQEPGRAVEIAAQLAEALAYAHSQGVVHRDIKPANVFLLADGTVKVTDFGIARVTGSSTMTQVGTVMGTPGYMSPEQVRGEQVDRRSDIFSAGVVLYELLTGVQAFEADSLASVMYKVVHEDPPPLPSLRPGLPDWVVAVVERACAKDPAARYQDASSLARDLRSASFPAPAAAPTLAAASPSTVVAPPVPHPDQTVLRPPGLEPPPPPGGPAPSRRLPVPALAAIIAAAVLLVAGGAIAALLLLSSSKVTVPDLEGLSYEKARSQLESAGLKASRNEVASDAYDPGEVIAMSPAPGQRVDKGATVKLDVAKANPPSSSYGSSSGSTSTTGSTGLTDTQTIGGPTSSTRIRDIRYAPHDDAGYFRVVFEIRSLDGSPTSSCPSARPSPVKWCKKLHRAIPSAMTA